jgi:hypothetical protein
MNPHTKIAFELISKFYARSDLFSLAHDRRDIFDFAKISLRESENLAV